MERATCKDGRPEGSNRVFHCTHDSPPFDLLVLASTGKLFSGRLQSDYFFIGFASPGFRISN
jgi:hypothetical protein